MVAHVGVASYDVRSHHLVGLGAIVDDNGNVAMRRQALRVLEGVEDDAHAHELLLVSVDGAFNVVGVIRDPESKAVTEKVLALSGDAEL